MRNCKERPYYYDWDIIWVYSLLTGNYNRDEVHQILSRSLNYQMGRWDRPWEANKNYLDDMAEAIEEVTWVVDCPLEVYKVNRETIGIVMELKKTALSDYEIRNEVIKRYGRERWKKLGMNVMA